MSMDFQRQMPGSKNSAESRWLYKLHLDLLLLVLVVAVLAFGLMVLFSAAGDQSRLFDAQFQRVLVAMAVLVVAAQLPPGLYFRWAPFVYVVGLLLLLLVLLVGVKVKGSQRWLEIPGLLRFQPWRLGTLRQSGHTQGRTPSRPPSHPPAGRRSPRLAGCWLQCTPS